MVSVMDKSLPEPPSASPHPLLSGTSGSNTGSGKSVTTNTSSSNGVGGGSSTAASSISAAATSSGGSSNNSKMASGDNYPYRGKPPRSGGLPYSASVDALTLQQQQMQMQQQQHQQSVLQQQQQQQSTPYAMHHHPPHHPHPSPLHHAHSQQAQAQAQASMGRSQSAFNFLLSKAKASFGRDGSGGGGGAQMQQPGVVPSASMPVVAQQQDGSGFYAHPGMAGSSSGPSSDDWYIAAGSGANRAPMIPMRRGSSGHGAPPGMGGSGTSAPISVPHSDPYPPPRPSFAGTHDEYQPSSVSSPTRRTFFGVGMGRERKTSQTASSSAAAAAAQAQAQAQGVFATSPLGRSNGDAGGSGEGGFPSMGHAGLFSRSQSDLHARSEAPPLPRDAATRAAQQQQQQQHQQGRKSPYLRSPSPQFSSQQSQFAFSRSVDDLSQLSNSGLMSTSPSAPQGANSKLQQQQGSSHLRSSNMPPPPLPTSTGSPMLRLPTSPHHGRAGSVGAPHHRDGVHARKHSKLPFMKAVNAASQGQQDAAARSGAVTGNANSSGSGSVGSATGLGLIGGPPSMTSSGSMSMRQVSSASTGATSIGSNTTGGDAGLSRQVSASPQSVPIPLLPPGATFQGLLQRNTNISLSFAQLAEGKEKDMNKGWKPFRVVLQDGSLHFYKPQSSSVADDAKALFPTGVVRAPMIRGGSSALADTYAGKMTMDADALKRSGLNTRDLLAATSSAASMSSTSLSPMQRPTGSSINESPSFQQLALPNPSMPIASKSPTMSAISDASAPPPAWQRAGHHPELILVTASSNPASWVARIASGSPAALAHELLHATQASLSTVEDAGAQDEVTPFARAVLIAALKANKAQAQSPLANLLHHVVSALEELQQREQDQSEGITEVVEAEKRARKLLDALDTELVPRHAAKEVAEASTRLAERLKVPPPAALAWLDAVPPTHDRETVAQPSGRAELRPLMNGNFPDSLLVTMPPQEVAQQIQAWHVREMRNMLHPYVDIEALLHPEPTERPLLSFDTDSVHPLTELVLEQIFAPPPVGNSNGGGESGQSAVAQAQAASRHRAAVLRHWIAVASYLQAYGDMAGWSAVVAAICSRAVARLEVTWRFVAPGDKDLVAKHWAPFLAKSGWSESRLSTQYLPIAAGASDIGPPRGPLGEQLVPLPYLGDLQISDNTSPPASSGSFLDVAGSVRATSTIYALLSDLHKGDTTYPLSDVPAVAPLLLEYSLLFDSLRHRRPQPTLAMHLDRSFMLEPRTLGLTDLSWRQRPSRASSANATVPLLFGNPLPWHRVVNEEEIMRIAHGDTNLPQFEANQGDSTITRSTRLNAAGSATILRSKTLPFSSASRTERRHSFARIFHPGQVGASDPTELKIGAELVLRPLGESLGSDTTSSPRGSKRFSQDFARISRPTSQVSKRSSLPASNRGSLVDLRTVMQVEVKAATLERLIDVMVMGVRHIQVSVADDNGEAPLARRSQLALDTVELVNSFLATYRSICAPSVLFELLRKRFVGAIHAGRELALPVQQRSSSQFPSWSYPISTGSSSAGTCDWDIVTRVRLGAIVILRRWLQEYAQDFIDDTALWNSVTSFLKERPTLNDFDEDPDRARINSFMDDAVTAFRIHVMRPNLDVELSSSRRSSSIAVTPTLLTSAQDEADFEIETATPQELVDYLESVAAVFSEKVSKRDYLIASELFERQTIDPLGWFPERNSSGEEEAPGTTMYKLLETIRLRGSHERVTLQQALPTALRDACAAQNLLRGWIAIQITEPRIGLARRQSRLAKLIDSVYICRSRMAKSRGLGAEGASSVFSKPSIAGFVEVAIISSLTSSESRIFGAAWQAVAQTRAGSIETLAKMVPPTDAALTLWEASGARACTIDVGWLLTCLAEAITQPYTVHDDGTPLITWDKYRHVWNLIDASSTTQPASQTELDLASNRLKSMQMALGGVVWDRKVFKDDAAREASLASGNAASGRWRAAKPLSGFLGVQHDRQRRVKDALQLLEQSRRTAAEAAAAADQRRAAAYTPAAVTPTSEKRSRRMTALFRSAVRTGTGDKHEPVPTAPKTANEILASIQTSKASLIAQLGGAQVAIWTNQQRSFVFHLTTFEGGKYLLQAPTQGEMADWIRHLDQTAKSYRPSQPAGKGGASTRILPLFGIPLQIIVEREASIVPRAIERMFAEIEARGLREQGIYRISGAKSAIMGLKAAFEKLPVDQVDISGGEFSDIHCIAGLIKQWFRDLPEPCIPYDCYHRMIAAEAIENEDARLSVIRDLIWSFPKPHFNLLERASQHLARVVEEGKFNLMAPHNIGLVFGTSLLNPPPSPGSVAEGFGNIGKAAHIVKIIVMAQEWLFEPIVEIEQPADEIVAPSSGSILIASPPFVDDKSLADEPQSNSQRGPLPSNSSQSDSTSPGTPTESLAPSLSAATITETTDTTPEIREHAPEEADEPGTIETPDPKSALRLTLPGTAPPATNGDAGVLRRNMPQREQEESIYLDAQDALEVLNFNFDDPVVSLASPQQEIDDPMAQLHSQLDAIVARQA